MSKRGRNPGFVMSDAHRVKIQKSNILNALIEHISGQREMSATQVNAGLGLLKKCLPDLSAVTITGADGGPIQTEEINARDILANRIAGIRARNRDTEGSSKPN